MSSTRPFRPQTNGNVERFNRTLATEWAYATTISATRPKPRNIPSSCITTITTDPTPASAAQHQRPRSQPHGEPQLAAPPYTAAVGGQSQRVPLEAANNLYRSSQSVGKVPNCRRLSDPQLSKLW